MLNAKYRILKKEKVKVSLSNTCRLHKLHRIVALRNIPSIGVKAGDYGGYVSSRHVLSHEGNSWIGKNAIAYGFVTIEENAVLRDEAVVYSRFEYKQILIRGNAVIGGNAKITRTGRFGSSSEKADSPDSYPTIVKGDAIIQGDSKVVNCRSIKDAVNILGSTDLQAVAEISGASVIVDAIVDQGSVIIDSKVLKYGKVGKNVTLIESTISSHAQLADNQIIENRIFDQAGIFVSAPRALPEIVIDENTGRMPSTQTVPVPLALEKKEFDISSVDSTNSEITLLQEIKEKIKAYETDIAKIIRYPIMTDRTDPHTVKMVTALNKAQRLSKNTSDPSFEQSVIDLEEKFLAAESNAIKISASYLSQDEIKRTGKAKDLFRIASDEAAGEHERKSALIQGFKQLEGVITVPEIAIDTFRVKLGFKEITM